MGERRDCIMGMTLEFSYTTRNDLPEYLNESCGGGMFVAIYIIYLKRLLDLSIRSFGEALHKEVRSACRPEEWS